MKKLLGLIFILLLFSAKSYSQTKQFPFYGFELNNYEVGDTLEYYSNYYEPPAMPSNVYTDIYRIIGKQLISSDSIRYTIEDIYSDNYGQGAHITQGKDTLQRIITNDTIYNNKNNILGELLPPLDTTHGNYIQYDTVGNLKTLWVNGETDCYHYYCGAYYYIAIQNLGLKVINKYGNDPPFYMDTLIYANLAHYGKYGNLNPIILGINNPSHSETSITIRYNNGQPILFISSTQPLSSLTLSIYDLLGRELQTIPVTVGNNLLNLNSLAKGMYLYEVTSNGNIIGQGKLMNL